MPMMPKGRYRIMTAYMPKVGTLRPRHDVSHLHRAGEPRLRLETDMVKKLRVSLALQPVATALFANSPFTEGKPNGFLSFRSQIWRDTDNARAGMLPWAFEPGMGFERYVDYALDVPMYFVKRGDTYIDVSGKLLRFLRRQARRIAGRTADNFRLGQPSHPRFSPRCGSSAIWKCAGPMAARGGACPRSPPIGSACSTTTLRSKSWAEFAKAGAPDLDFVFTVCDNAAGEACPLWPGQPMTAHWGIPDPAAATAARPRSRCAFADAYRMLNRRIDIVLWRCRSHKLDRLVLTDAAEGNRPQREGATAKAQHVDV